MSAFRVVLNATLANTVHLLPCVGNREELTFAAHGVSRFCKGGFFDKSERHKLFQTFTEADVEHGIQALDINPPSSAEQLFKYW